MQCFFFKKPVVYAPVSNDRGLKTNCYQYKRIQNNHFKMAVTFISTKLKPFVSFLDDYGGTKGGEEAIAIMKGNCHRFSVNTELGLRKSQFRLKPVTNA